MGEGGASGVNCCYHQSVSQRRGWGYHVFPGQTTAHSESGVVVVVVGAAWRVVQMSPEKVDRTILRSDML